MMKTSHEEPGSEQAQAWDKAAEGWYHNAALVNTWLQEVTPAMLDAAGIGPGARVLDVAAGAGGQTLAIARRVGGSGYVLARTCLPSRTAYMDFIQSSGSPIMAIVAPLSERQKARAWNDMREQLDQFATEAGWCGPNELLLASARV